MSEPKHSGSASVESGLDVSTIRTTLNFYLEPSKGGHSSYSVGTAGYYRRKFDTQPVDVHDLRGQLEDFTLHTHGFQFCRHTSTQTTFTDDAQMKKVVYAEVEQLLREVTGATKVQVFSHIVRQQSRDATETAIAAARISDDAQVTAVTPARFVHIDQSYHGAWQVLRDNLPPEDVARLKNTRWSIINVWRPIKGPVIKDPLAVCDSRTVKDEDLVPIMNHLPPKGSMSYSDISKGDGFEEFYLRYDPDQKWYYVSGMTREEVILIKCFDSIQDGQTARRAPHSAFVDPKTAHIDVVRESVEVRSLVFYEDQPVL